MHAPLAHATGRCSRYQQYHPLHLVDFEKHNNITKWLYYATKLTALCCPQSLIYCNIISVASTVAMSLKKKKIVAMKNSFLKNEEKRKRKNIYFASLGSASLSSDYIYQAMNIEDPK